MKDERDDFWDVASLLPKTKKRAGRVSYDTLGVDISEPETVRDMAKENSQKLSRESLASQTRKNETPLFDYAPDSPFIRRVSVYSQDSAYRYYEDFDAAMHKYLRLTVKEAVRVPFFSYVPQYSQLSSERLSWYLYWRSGCRRREYMQTDYSYVLLYVFELLNFDNPRYPDRMIEELCQLWRAYRRDYPQLDRCMPDWVCDYCLIHRVSLPYSVVGDFVDGFLQYATLREFYLGLGEYNEDGYARALILGASGYNYKNSKFYAAEHKALYDEHILSAAAYAVGASSEQFRDVCRGEKMSVLRRDAYAGALCTYKAKRVVVAQYLPLYRSGELRMDATFAVKYAENRLRAYIGVRSRLGVDGMSERIRAAVDEYFDSHLGRLPRSYRDSDFDARVEASYMTYYEAPSSSLEMERAISIEEDSWETATLMGETFEDDAVEEVSETEESSDAQTDVDTAPIRLDAHMREVLSLISQGKSAEAKRFAVSAGGFISDVVERINESALDLIGDVVIESYDGEYRIIEDYESEVSLWLKI